MLREQGTGGAAACQTAGQGVSTTCPTGAAAWHTKVMTSSVTSAWPPPRFSGADKRTAGAGAAAAGCGGSSDDEDDAEAAMLTEEEALIVTSRLHQVRWLSGSFLSLNACSKVTKVEWAS